MKNFDQHIKNSLDNFEADYNPADWTDMQNRLSRAQAGKSSNHIGKALLIAASVLVVGGAIYYFSSNESANSVTAENGNAQTAEPVVVKNENNKQQGVVVKEESSANTSAVKEEPKQNASAASKTSEPKNEKPVNSEPAPLANKNEAPVKEDKSIAMEPNPSLSSAVAISAAFHAESNKICEESPVKFIPEKMDEGVSYKWYFGDGESSSEPMPTHTFAGDGPYDVKLTVTSLKDKTKFDKRLVKVTVGGKPSVRLDMNPSEDNLLSVGFEGDGDKVTDWKWDFGDKGTSTSQNPSHNYRKYGTYNVTLTVKNAAGCVAVAQEELNLQLNLHAGTKFTPYKDDHNTFMPEALRDGEYDFTFIVSDKFGKEVYKTFDKDAPWNGTVNGKVAAIGDTFRWTAIVKMKNGEEVPCTGVVTIAKE